MASVVFKYLYNNIDKYSISTVYSISMKYLYLYCTLRMKQSTVCVLSCHVRAEDERNEIAFLRE